MTRYWVSHRTTYHFDAPVGAVSVNVRLTPRTSARQSVGFCELVTEPVAETGGAREDAFGNLTERLVFRAGIRRLEIRAQSHVSIDAAGDALSPLRSAPPATFKRAAAPPALEGSLIWAWASETLPPRDPSTDAVEGFIRRLHLDFVYDPTATGIGTPLDVFFRRCRGVCEDFAGLAAACLRARGVPVALLGGYLADAASARGGRHPHVWLAAYLGDAGWIAFDPTLGADPADHLLLSVGAVLEDLQPVTGAIEDGEAVGQTLEVDVTVSESP